MENNVVMIVVMNYHVMLVDTLIFRRCAQLASDFSKIIHRGKFSEEIFCMKLTKMFPDILFLKPALHLRLELSMYPTCITG